MFKFSPITAIFSFNTSFTVFPASFAHDSAKKASKSLASLTKTCSATSSTKFWKSSFLATKSVSEFTSTIPATLSSLTTTFTAPSAAILPAFLLAAARPFSL